MKAKAKAKATIFARPNLKIFFLGALLVAAVQHLINDGFSQGARWDDALIVQAREAAAVEQIVSQAAHFPASHLFAQLSDHYQERGEYRKALRFLRLAQLAAETEGDLDLE
jgi:hypothetical protein